MKALQGSANSAYTVKADIPMIASQPYVLIAETDQTTLEKFHDIYAHLDNPSEIAAGTEIALTIFPITNPPS